VKIYKFPFTVLLTYFNFQEASVKKFKEKNRGNFPVCSFPCSFNAYYWTLFARDFGL